MGLGLVWVRVRVSLGGSCRVRGRGTFVGFGLGLVCDLIHTLYALTVCLLFVCLFVCL